MKRKKLLWLIISAVCLVLFACSSEKTTEKDMKGETISIEKRIGEENQYEHFREIAEAENLVKIKEIVHKIEWENAKVSMVRPPDYKFQFKGGDGQNRSVYDLWISPNKDKIELVVEGESKYVQLNKTKSESLFTALTDTSLSDLK